MTNLEKKKLKLTHFYSHKQYISAPKMKTSPPSVWVAVMSAM